jgi:hypothetical protein
MSVYNITMAKQSFKEDFFVKLDPRINLNADAILQVSRKVDVIPQMLIMKQGRYYEVTAGGMVKYYLSTGRYNYRAIYGGIYTRAVDAAFVMAGFDYNEWYFGFSYDLNYSKLIPASQGRGGWEIAVKYIIPRIPDRFQYRRCPDFR